MNFIICFSLALGHTLEATIMILFYLFVLIHLIKLGVGTEILFCIEREVWQPSRYLWGRLCLAVFVRNVLLRCKNTYTIKEVNRRHILQWCGYRCKKHKYPLQFKIFRLGFSSDTYRETLTWWKDLDVVSFVWGRERSKVKKQTPVCFPVVWF